MRAAARVTDLGGFAGLTWPVERSKGMLQKRRWQRAKSKKKPRTSGARRVIWRRMRGLVGHAFDDE